MRHRLWLLGSFYILIQWINADIEFLEKVCYNALETRDPLCQHGGHLHASNLSDYLNCATCDCPGGWKGIDCGLCASKDTCPIQNGTQALRCSSNDVAPSAEERILGKSLSCYCAGEDGTTKYICDQQPRTHWQMFISPAREDQSFNMTVIERAGIPSQDYHPSCGGHDPNKCSTKERYRYSASQVWEGTLHDCTWKRGSCIKPMEGNDCVVYTCKRLKIQCPPTYVKKCPGWTPFKCGNPEGEERPYWMHHCNALALPMEQLPLTLACKESIKDGRFQCFLSQENSIFSSIGMQCETGSCIYIDAPKDVGKRYEKHDKSFAHWLDEHQAALLIRFMWFCLIVLLIIAIILIIKDKRRSLKRAEVWANDAENNIDVYLAPLLQARTSQVDLMLSQSLKLCFRNIDFYVKMRGNKIKRILKSVHGLVVPTYTHQGQVGSMLAIMGPSGAGKTSLLDILSGYRRVGVSGTVTVNGITINAGSRVMRKIAGYVQQDDVLPGTSTVFEYLLFNAALRMPHHVTREEKEKRVFDVIQQLGLNKIAHNFVGDQFTRGISGGEKRRVSIACERLVGPKLVFLDEPTTGLDSTNASKVVDILSDMASSGVTIVMSVHQPRPDLFRTLDQTMLLSEIGQVIYSGPAMEAENYFNALGYVSPRKTVHVMDFMLDVVIKTEASTVNEMVERFAQSDLKKHEDEIVAELHNNTAEIPIVKFRPSFFQQVRFVHQH